jgi:hypothetical protein
MRVSILARGAGVTMAAVAALAGSACSGGADGAPTPTTSAAPVSADLAGGPASAQAETAQSGPCGLLTAADVKTALGQAVRDLQRYETVSDDTGTIERCAFLTDGTPLGGPALDNLSMVATGFTGQDMPILTTANVGVIRITRTAPYDAAQGDTGKLPDGSKTLTGVGSFAMVLGVSGSGGIAFAQTGPTGMLVVYDSEDRTIAAAQMEALLRSAVGHL